MNGECILCGHNLKDSVIFECKKMPSVSQELPIDEDDKNCEAIDLPLCQCVECGLVQFDCVPVSYYKDSTRAGERCDALIALRQKQYKHLIETYELHGKKILEVGAGKGGYLKTLKEMSEYSIQEYGIEYNEEFVRIARETEDVNEFQGDPENEETDMPGAPYDAFVSFSYPARLINPNSMVRLVHRSTTDDAVGLVMVPSLEHLLSSEGFFDIARDHIAYYSVNTLRLLFENNGFDVLEYGEESSLYIYMIVKKRQLIDMASYWQDVDTIMEQTREFVQERKKRGKKVAVWCAGHFAFTVLSVSELGNEIEYIIDNAPFKQGCFAPGSKVKIVSPNYYKDKPVDTIMILGPIYVDEIVKEIYEKCSRNIEIVTLSTNGINHIE